MTFPTIALGATQVIAAVALVLVTYRLARVTGDMAHSSSDMADETAKTNRAYEVQATNVANLTNALRDAVRTWQEELERNRVVIRQLIAEEVWRNLQALTTPGADWKTTVETSEWDLLRDELVWDPDTVAILRWFYGEVVPLIQGKDSAAIMAMTVPGPGTGDWEVMEAVQRFLGPLLDQWQTRGLVRSNAVGLPIMRVRAGSAAVHEYYHRHRDGNQSRKDPAE